MIYVNLLPVRAAQKKERQRIQLSIFVLCLLLAVAACAGLYVREMLAINQTKDQISQIDQQNRALRDKIGQVRDFEKKKSELEKKLDILATLKANKAGPVHLLDDLSSALPEKLWLTQFSEKGGRISLSGVADDENTLAEFMKTLEASGYYQGIELAVTEQSRIAEQKWQKFSLNCSAELPPAKPTGEN